MENNLFLDINIVLDILIESRAEHKRAIEILDDILDFNIFISEDMLTTIYYISKDKAKTLKFLEVIQDEWNIVPFGEDVIREAVKYSQSNSSDLEDTLQCFCAKKYNCIFLTSDKKFINCGIKIFNYNNWR